MTVRTFYLTVHRLQIESPLETGGLARNNLRKL